MTSSADARYVALSGGVGGAKLALGLCDVLADPGRLIVVANTGDDFEHLGLKVCPDLDTLTYTLAGLANEETGWGRAGESGAFMEALGALGGETWFFLGDKDLAIHVERTRRLRTGESLSAITSDLCARLGVPARIVPMSDDPVPTIVETEDGPLAFQHYFVRERCRPRVLGFRHEGAAQARPCAAFIDALGAPGLGAVIVCPSNPYISIDPILAVPGVQGALAACRAPVIAVSPIVGGKAVKGPTAKMMAERGIAPSAAAIARHYAGLIDGFVLDEADRPQASAIAATGVAVEVAPTVMTSRADKQALARTVLAFAGRIGAAG
ncbi:MAG: 2-phospho-L-lactate transferase [Rhodospirillales bacterium]|nr:2-phospho-L-lactate transferase [Rhodospirillales bacterium]MDE0380320.1 2-phospho-L-lactate transferase [Rhodospirillales bacterium]